MRERSSQKNTPVIPHNVQPKKRSNLSTINSIILYVISILRQIFNASYTPSLHTLPSLYIYILQPRTSRRRSPPENHPIITPPCPTPFKHIIPRLSMCTRYPCRGMNYLIGSCMSRRSCVVMGPRWEASRRGRSIVHCVGGTGTVCFGGGVVAC